jgi:hypothetical protein
MFEWFSSSNSTERLDTGLIEVWLPKQSDAPNLLAFEKIFDPIRIEEETVK